LNGLGRHGKAEAVSVVLEALMTVRFRLAASVAALIVGVGFLVAQAAAQQHGPDGRHGRGPAPQISPEDRAAFLDARLAAIHAGLRLSADQEKFWPPMEAAARERAQIQMETRRKEAEAGAPANLIAGLRRRGETDAARGAADMRLADAAQPLWASLSDEQKRRFPVLARGVINAGGPEQRARGDHGEGPGRRDRPMGHERSGPRLDDRQPPGPH